MKRIRLFPLVALLLAPTLAGCVTRSEHERQLAAAAERLRQSEANAAAAMAAAQKQIADLKAEIQRLNQEVATRDGQITDAEGKIASLQKRLDEATALNQQLGDELKKAGKNVDKLMAGLEDAKVRLDELRRAQEAAQKRAELLKNLIGKFKKLIDSGELKIVMRDGRMTLQLRNDVLFDSGRVDIKPAGKEALKEVAGVLATLTDRKWQVVGHTDDRPIATERFPSNWELSAARAIAVVKFLGSEGLDAKLVSAAGHSQYDPVSPNDTDEGRAKNRRIEIVLQPDLQDLVSVPVD